LLLVSVYGLGAATNSVPPLIIKGVVDTNASGLWSPWSCWWLRPATNAAHGAVAEVAGETNKVAEAANLSLGETNVVKDTGEASPDAGTSNGNVTEFGARILSGRPIGHRNVEMGQQNLQLGKPAVGLGPNNMQPGQAGGGVGKTGTGIGQPAHFPGK
jgi:hypothetical protein